MTAAGRIGAGTEPDNAVLQVQGNAIFGDYANNNYGTFDLDGDLSFAGTSDYLVGGNRYAFRYGVNQNFGLYFSSTNGHYEFKDGSANASFYIHANTGNGVFAGDVTATAFNQSSDVRFKKNVKGLILA